MDALLNTHNDSCAFFHFERSRLNGLFSQAIKSPMVLVCAGAGYGKTSAVRDFTQQNKIETMWMQLSERDNVSDDFWENFTSTLSQVNEPLAGALGKLCFPDTASQLNHYKALMRQHLELKQRIIVMDDFHFIKDPAIICFVEHAFLNLPYGSSVILISRSTPRINTAGLVSRGRIFNVREEELLFTKNEIAQYYRRLNISLQPESGYPEDTLQEIMQDTGGWAFAINLIARFYRNLPQMQISGKRDEIPARKLPPYAGYLRTAMKSNIFHLMKTESWDGITERLQHFLIRISLIDHLSVDIITLLAGDDESLIGDLELQHAYVRRDSYINAYLIHPLFLEFLSAKQDLLSDEQKRRTYAIAGEWCDRNGFKINAISYYEKIGDYESIVNIFIFLPAQIPQDISRYTSAVLERAPAHAFDTVLFLASTHLRSFMCQGLWQKSMDLAEFYEKKYLKLPKNDSFRRNNLASIYYCWAVARASMNLNGDCCDFDRYYKKLDECFSQPVDPGDLIKPCPGPWICGAGSGEKGSPDKFIEALRRSAVHMARCFNGLQTGEDDLALGELKFYQGDIGAAETHISLALERAKEKRQFEFIHRALLYKMRIAAYNGNYRKMELAIEGTKAQQSESDYQNRFTNYDISLSWYCFILDLPEKVPDWIQGIFSPYSYASFIENFANQAKVRYCYMTRNYPPLLAYIQEMRQRESYLFGRVEMLAMEACMQYKMKNYKKACDVLTEAYEAASPNDLLMPFIELGKDMRTLTAFALKEADCGISESWLETVNRKSSTYAKRQAHVISEYKQANGVAYDIVISQRETEILTDLSHGLSRAEIAISRGVSINTVKMQIANIYMKLGAENLADALRIATERKMI